MEQILLVVHVLVALSMIGLIMVQQGKGAEAGASFGGGASQTIFGSSGGGNFFTRATAVLATVFFVTSFSLAVVAKQQARVAGIEGIPTVEQPAEIPALFEEPVDMDVPVEFDESIPGSELPQ
jgi:preprotein translocase subunit SecG